MGDFLERPKSRNAKLRELLRSAQPVTAMGCHDGLSGRLVEQAGFEVAYLGGFASTGSLLGRPDVGILAGSEMVDNARRVAATVTIPVLADADTGYGNAINVVRTVHDYEQAGVSGIHLEDQVAPKRCGHMAGKAVIAAGEMVGKIKAAVAARTDPDFVIIGRTDALAVEGVEKAIDRALRYGDAGADVLWVEAPTTEDELVRISERLQGHVTLLNWLEGGRTPMISMERIKELAFGVIGFPLGSVLTTMAALREHYAEVRRSGVPTKERLSKLPSFEDFTKGVGIAEIEILEKQFADPDEQGKVA